MTGPGGPEGGLAAALDPTWAVMVQADDPRLAAVPECYRAAFIGRDLTELENYWRRVAVIEAWLRNELDKLTAAKVVFR